LIEKKIFRIGKRRRKELLVDANLKLNCLLARSASFRVSKTGG
jgi:hypothetical protein